MSITATPITTTSTDSYLTVAEADAVFAARLGAATWTAASTADKTAALKMATAIIDSLTYTGFKQSETQARQFPRMYQFDPDFYSPWAVTEPDFSTAGDCINVDTPDDVLSACCLEALALLEYYSSSSPINEGDLIAKGVKSFSLGKLSMSFGSSASLQSGFRSKEAFDLLEKYHENSVLIT